MVVVSYEFLLLIGEVEVWIYNQYIWATLAKVPLEWVGGGTLLLLSLSPYNLSKSHVLFYFFHVYNVLTKKKPYFVAG